MSRTLVYTIVDNPIFMQVIQLCLVPKTLQFKNYKIIRGKFEYRKIVQVDSINTVNMDHNLI